MTSKLPKRVIYYALYVRLARSLTRGFQRLIPLHTLATRLAGIIQITPDLDTRLTPSHLPTRLYHLYPALLILILDTQT